VKDVTKECQIGIAIFMGKDEVSKTLGSASNKIYEYAACGLPVIAYDNEQFRKHIGKYSWVTFTDGSIPSLKKAIEHIINNYNSLSIAAKNDFENIFYFENAFTKAISELRNH
jgi:glycosyltransferase involved in cell wall biosynthesis